MKGLGQIAHSAKEIGGRGWRFGWQIIATWLSPRSLKDHSSQAGICVLRKVANFCNWDAARVDKHRANPFQGLPVFG